MVEQEFKTLAKDNHCNYTVEHSKVYGNMGSILPIAIYRMTILHNGTDITLNYEFGNANIAQITFEIEWPSSLPEVEITNRNNFQRLFFKKNKIWSITSQQHSFKRFLEQALKSSGLSNLASTHAFEPIMKGQDTNGVYQFDTKYYLGFTDKEKSITPILEFHKNIVTHLKSKY